MIYKQVKATSSEYLLLDNYRYKIAQFQEDLKTFKYYVDYYDLNISQLDNISLSLNSLLEYIDNEIRNIEIKG